MSATRNDDGSGSGSGSGTGDENGLANHAADRRMNQRSMDQTEYNLLDICWIFYNSRA